MVCPGGVAVIDGELTVKPWPKEMAQWPQHYNTPDNNAVALDSAVGPPRHFRWIAEPEWQRSHLGLPSMHSLVSAGGRLYSIEDCASVEHPALPGKPALICRDAFNGIELWRIPLPEDQWGWKAWSAYPDQRFNQPNQIPKRLVAVGETVYVTLGFNAPVTALDAATGRVVRTYAETEMTDEILLHDGVLLLVVVDRVREKTAAGEARRGTTGSPGAAPPRVRR